MSREPKLVSPILLFPYTKGGENLSLQLCYSSVCSSLLHPLTLILTIFSFSHRKESTETRESFNLILPAYTFSLTSLPLSISSCSLSLPLPISSCSLSQFPRSSSPSPTYFLFPLFSHLYFFLSLFSHSIYEKEKEKLTFFSLQIRVFQLE